MMLLRRLNLLLGIELSVTKSVLRVNFRRLYDAPWRDYPDMRKDAFKSMDEIHSHVQKTIHSDEGGPLFAFYAIGSEFANAANEPQIRSLADEIVRASRDSDAQYIRCITNTYPNLKVLIYMYENHAEASYTAVIFTWSDPFFHIWTYFMRAEAAKFVRALDRIATRALLILDQETLRRAVEALTIDGAIEFDEIPLKYLLGFLNVFYDGIEIDDDPDPEIHRRHKLGFDTSELFPLCDIIDADLPRIWLRAEWSKAQNTEEQDVLNGTAVVSDQPIYISARYGDKTASIRICRYKFQPYGDSDEPPSIYHQISVVFL